MWKKKKKLSLLRLMSEFYKAACCIPAQTLMLYWKHSTILRKIDLVSGGILYIYGLFFFHSQHLNAEEPLYCCTEKASLILLP